MKILAVITRPLDVVLLAPLVLARLITRAVVTHRPDGVS